MHVLNLLIHWQSIVLACSWWRHQMEIISALLAICAGNSPVTRELPAQRPLTRSIDVFFDLRLNKRLSKQWRGWWLDTPSCPLWCHCNAAITHWDFTQIFNVSTTRYNSLTLALWEGNSPVTNCFLTKGQLCGKRFHVKSSLYCCDITQACQS